MHLGSTVCHLGKKNPTKQQSKEREGRGQAREIQTFTQHLNQTLSQPFLSALSHPSLPPLQEGAEKCSTYVLAQQPQNEFKNSTSLACLR